MSLADSAVYVKTREIRHPDGRVEILRLLSLEEMEEWSVYDPICYEKSVVWLEDIAHLPWVRAIVVKHARSRRGKLEVPRPARAMGYTTLTHNAAKDDQTGAYVRRLFYLTEADQRAQAEGRAAPRGTLDPRTILPGVPGRPPHPSL